MAVAVELLMDALALELQKEKSKPIASKPIVNTQNNHSHAPVTNPSSRSQKSKTVEFKVPSAKAPMTNTDGKTIAL